MIKNLVNDPQSQNDSQGLNHNECVKVYFWVLENEVFHNATDQVEKCICRKKREASPPTLSQQYAGESGEQNQLPNPQSLHCEPHGCDLYAHKRILSAAVVNKRFVSAPLPKLPNAKTETWTQ